MEPTNISKSSSTESIASDVELLRIDEPTPDLEAPIFKLSKFRACWLIAEHESLLKIRYPFLVNIGTWVLLLK